MGNQRLAGSPSPTPSSSTTKSSTSSPTDVAPRSPGPLVTSLYRRTLSRRASPGRMADHLRRAREARLQAAMDLIFRRALGATKYCLRRASRLAMRVSSRKRRSASSSSSGPSSTIRLPACPCLSSKTWAQCSPRASCPVASDWVNARLCACLWRCSSRLCACSLCTSLRSHAAFNLKGSQP